jgi:small GTP-binding protein
MDRVHLIKKKICLLGAFAVGKTSLVQRFVHNRFDEKYLTTIGVKVSEKVLPPLENAAAGGKVQHAFVIWDIAGLEKFDKVAVHYFRGAAGALAVADLTRPETIDDLHGFCDKFMQVNPGARLQVIGNKADIFEADKSVTARLQEAAEAFGTRVTIASAKTGENVEQAFGRLGRSLVKEP